MKKESPQHSKDSSVVFFDPKCVETILKDMVSDLNILQQNDKTENSKTICHCTKEHIIPITLIELNIRLAPHTLNDKLNKINKEIGTSLDLSHFDECRTERSRK